MNMKERRIITFGASGLTECEMLVPVGSARLRVRFAGGSVSGFGEVPATYTTANEVLQTAIMRSPQFRAGRIRIVNERRVMTCR